MSASQARRAPRVTRLAKEEARRAHNRGSGEGGSTRTIWLRPCRAVALCVKDNWAFSSAFPYRDYEGTGPEIVKCLFAGSEGDYDESNTKNESGDELCQFAA